VDGLIATISRSGFLALAVGGVIYNWFTPGKLGKQVRLLSVLAVALFLMLTGPSYWTRMQSIEHAGEDVQGVDTGEDRIAIIQAQWRMFEQYPMGCGAMCTAVLSPQFIEARYLAHDSGAERRRASHNTFMTMLVEHGVPGVVFYVAMVLWIYRGLKKLALAYKNSTGFQPTLFPAVAAILAGITVGDMFVSYAKYEIRIWFIAILMAMLNLVAQKKLAEAAAPVKAGVAPGSPVGAMQTPAKPGAVRAMLKSGSQRAAGDSEMPSGLP
jgi:O-antigen ligase